MRQKRYQRGSLKPRKRNGKRYWYAQWRENGKPKSKELGQCSQMNKSEADALLAAILEPFNRGIPQGQTPIFSFTQFVEGVYLPVCRRKNKASTVMTTEQTVRKHLVEELGPMLLNEIGRQQLQGLLDAKAATHSRSVVDHLRWQLHAIWELAISEGAADRNVAKALYTPECQPGRERRDLQVADVSRLLAALKLRERLMAKLAIFEGMRPGEILALQWQHVGEESFEVRQRVYRGDIDKPKTRKSVRIGALSLATLEDLKAWREAARDLSPEGWVFPSESLKTPLSRDNVWRRNMRPNLLKIGLEWADFQVMRRANASLGRKAGIDDKVAADQRGHGVGVSLEVYASSDLAQKIEAVRKLETALIQ